VTEERSAVSRKDGVGFMPKGARVFSEC